MSRSRLPFWATLLTTLALGACLKQADNVDFGEGDEVATTEPGRYDGATVEDATEKPVGMEQTVSATGVSASPVGPSVVVSSPVTRTEAQGEGGEDSSIAGLDGEPDAIFYGRDAAAAPSEPTMDPSPAPESEEARPRPTRRPAATPRLKAAESVAIGGSTSAGPVYRPPTVTRPPVLPDPVDIPVTVDRENYTDYGVNGFVLTDRDALSTFAVDVDTASYAMTRRKLNDGYLPPTAAVRVEEFVNYFPYEYQRPEPGDPFAVDFEATPSPWNPKNHVVRVGVQGRKVGMDDRKSVHLTFLIDVSGSMRSSDKIDLVKKSLKMLTEELSDGDTIAIATYAGRTDIVLEPTPVGDKTTILRSLDRLTAGGSTAMSSGIDLAYRLADASYVPGAVNRVIIASDGDANVGATSHETISEQIRGYAQKGVTLTTLGFGTGNYQDTMMERLANDGDGNYFYIDSEMEARRVLVDKMTGTLEVIAKDVKIQVDWNPEAVIAYRLIGYENRDVADTDFRNDEVDAGEIGSGHQVTAIYEVALKDDPAGNLAIVRIRNKAPGPDAPAVERSTALSTAAIKTRFDEGSDQFRVAFAAASFAEVLRGSLEEVSLRDVESVARSAARPEYPEDAELVALIDRAAKLRGEGGITRR